MRGLTGQTPASFQNELEAAIDENDHAVILDLQRLFYISSAGLRVILLTAKALGRREAKLVVCALFGTGAGNFCDQWLR